MKQVKVSGVVISESNMGDYDKMVTLLTPNFGKISCSARGARRNKSLLLAGTQFLCFGEYQLFKGGDSYKINSCETIEMFYNLRTDLDKLTYSSYITKIVSDVTTENQNSYNTLKLFLNTLYTISETEKDLDSSALTYFCLKKPDNSVSKTCICLIDSCIDKLSAACKKSWRPITTDLERLKFRAAITLPICRLYM